MDTLQSAKAELAGANKEITDYINSFIDEKSFVETDAFVCSETVLADAPGEGVVSGFASVDGMGVCVFATNPAVLKGAIGALNAKKIVRTINNAIATNKPLIAVWDTAGARFSEGINCLEGYGNILKAYAKAYDRVPVITVIKGNNLGLSAYVAGVSDFVIAGKNSVLATASPLVISAKTKTENVGSCDKLVESGIVTNVTDELKPTLVKILGFCMGEVKSSDDLNRQCKGLKLGVKPMNVIKEVFDKGSFFAIRENFAPETVTGFAILGETPVGVIAPSAGGRISVDGCKKIKEMLGLCDDFDMPIVMLTDCLGTDYVKDDAALLREMSDVVYYMNSISSPVFSVVYGSAVGSAYTSFVAPADYKIAWDGAYIGTVESEAAARLLYSDDIAAAKNKEKAVKALSESYAAENCSALAIAKSGYFDNVIEPNHTRSYLIAALLAHLE